MKISIGKFAERKKYLTASEIGTICSHYSINKFPTYQPFLKIASAKKYEKDGLLTELEKEKKSFLFLQGHEFQNNIYEYLKSKYTNKTLEIECFTNDYTLIWKKMRLSASPDILIINKEQKCIYVCECKRGSFSTISSRGGHFEEYKYQLAQQIMLLREMTKYAGYSFKGCFYFSTDFFMQKDKNLDYIPIEVPNQQIDTMIENIKEASQKFWDDFDNNRIAFIPYHSKDTYDKTSKIEALVKKEKLIEDLKAECDAERLEIEELMMQEINAGENKDGKLTKKYDWATISYFKKGEYKKTYRNVLEEVKEKYHKIEQQKQEIEKLENSCANQNPDDIYDQSDGKYELKITINKGYVWNK